jgi:hypothetical protein
VFRRRSRQERAEFIFVFICISLREGTDECHGLVCYAVSSV